MPLSPIPVDKPDQAIVPPLTVFYGPVKYGSTRYVLAKIERSGLIGMDWSQVLYKSTDNGSTWARVDVGTIWDWPCGTGGIYYPTSGGNIFYVWANPGGTTGGITVYTFNMDTETLSVVHTIAQAYPVTSHPSVCSNNGSVIIFQAEQPSYPNPTTYLYSVTPSGTKTLIDSQVDGYIVSVGSAEDSQNPGNIYLAYVKYPNTDYSSRNRTCYFTRSLDGGASWSAPISFAGVLGNIPLVRDGKVFLALFGDTNAHSAGPLYLRYADTATLTWTTLLLAPSVPYPADDQQRYSDVVMAWMDDSDTDVNVYIFWGLYHHSNATNPAAEGTQYIYYRYLNTSTGALSSPVLYWTWVSKPAEFEGRYIEDMSFSKYEPPDPVNGKFEGVVGMAVWYDEYYEICNLLVYFPETWEGAQLVTRSVSDIMLFEDGFVPGFVDTTPVVVPPSDCLQYANFEVPTYAVGEAGVVPEEWIESIQSQDDEKDCSSPFWTVR